MHLQHTLAKRLYSVVIMCGLAACTGAQELVPEHPSDPAARDPAVQGVIAEEVVLFSPAPAGNGRAPAACDRIRYLRFRPATDTGEPCAVRAVVLMIPGYLGGAGSFTSLARNLVGLAGTATPVEVWAIDRRANCLEDQAGMQEAERIGKPRAALDYYLNGSTVDGRAFGGFYGPADTPYLSEFGLDLLMRDIQAVLAEAIPDPAQRKKTVFIAGHSMGAALAAAFAAWDFDRDPATLADAGFNSCAGLIGLEGSVGIWPSTTNRRRYEQRLAALRAAGPDEPFITPQAMALIEILALYAAFEPEEESSLFRSLTVEPATESLIEYFTTYGLEAAGGRPALGDFHVSNEAMLGLFADDNFQPVGIGRASLGFLAGGPVRRRYVFPGGGRLFVAARADNATRYTWANFDTIGSSGDGAFTDVTGRALLTSRESEVTDLQEYARCVYEGPLNFYEWYYPERLGLDLGIAAEPFRTDFGISTLHLDRLDSMPTREFFAGGLPGYDHLDVLCAAADRTQRRHNEVIGPLLEFLLEHSAGTVLVP